jgi:hypothetical protein
MSSRSVLSVKVKPPAGPIHLGEPCLIEVTIRNMGKSRVLLNRRLAVGYGDNLSRELFFDLFDPVNGQRVNVIQVDYSREFSPSTDYAYLGAGKSVSRVFDLFEWYAPAQPGTCQLIAHYQADEPLATTSENVIQGVYSSDPISLVVLSGVMDG